MNPSILRSPFVFDAIGPRASGGFSVAAALVAGRRPVFGSRFFGEAEGHRAGDGDDVVTPLVADQQVRGPGLHAVVLDEPVGHVARGHLEAVVEGAGELGLRADADDLVGRLDPRPGQLRRPS